MAIIVNKKDEAFFQLKCEYDVALELKEFFSCHKKGFQFHPKYKYGSWNGKISFFNIEECTLPIGLYPQLNEFSKKFGYKLQLNFDTSSMRNEISQEDLQELYNNIFNENFMPREHQHISIKKCIEFKRGIIEAVTSSGKSNMLYALTRFILATNPDKKVLIVVPSISLVNQMASDFEEYGFTEAKECISKLYGTSKSYDKDKPILISTWQSIYKRPISFFKDFVGVICDEVHMASTKSNMSGIGGIHKVLSKCINAEYRLGFTGTLPKDKSDLWTIYGYLGPKLHKVGYKELMDKGILSKLIIANILIKYPEQFCKMNRKRPYPEEVKEINNYEDRNKVFNFILDKIDKKDNMIILCTYIDHLKKVMNYIKENYPDRKIYQVYGKTDVDDREEIRKSIDNEEGVILIATFKTMGTGINIKRIHHVIAASSYKSQIVTFQALGRGLRIFPDKKKLIYWDLVDDLRFENKNKTITKNHIFKQFEERMENYKEAEFSTVTTKFELDKL